jgi:hypothetical protein
MLVLTLGLTLNHMRCQAKNAADSSLFERDAFISNNSIAYTERVPEKE